MKLPKVSDEKTESEMNMLRETVLSEFISNKREKRKQQRCGENWESSKTPGREL